MNVIRVTAACLFCAGLALFAGCEVDSASDVQREVGVDFTGFYKNDQGGAIVSKNSGSSITSLDLRQGGDRLEAITDDGIIFKGSIGTFDGTTASFELNGKTTVGNKATISGTLTTSGGTDTNSSGSTKGTMQGTWIEDSFYATVRAVATIPGISSGGGGGSGDFSITASSTTVAVGGSIQLTATGNSGTVNWTTQNGRGHFSSSSGTAVSFTRDVAGTEVITGTDSDGSETDSISVN